MSEKRFDCWKQVLFKPVLLFQQMQKGSGLSTLSSLVSIRFLLPIQLCSLVYLVSRCKFALRLFIRTSTFVETSGWQEI